MKISERCSVLQRKIIINSILYYEMDESILTDKEFDYMCRRLLELKEKTKYYSRTDYFYCFYDFDGTTGFHLYDRLYDGDKKYLTHIAQHVLKQWKLKNKNKKEKVENEEDEWDGWEEW